MENLLYIVGVILIIGWGVGFFAFGLGKMIHILLILALVSLTVQLIKRK